MKSFLFFACFALIVCTALGTVSAYQRLCLTDGQSVPSSENPRYTCTHDSCQVCVDDDLYPTALSRCNNMECEPFEEADGGNQDDDNTDESENDGGPEDGVINVDTHADEDDSSSNSDTNSNSNSNSNSNTNSDSSTSSQNENPIIINEPSEIPDEYESDRQTGNVISDIIPDASENTAVNKASTSSSSFNKPLFFISTGSTILLIIILTVLLIINNSRVPPSYEAAQEVKPAIKRRKTL